MSRGVRRRLELLSNLEAFEVGIYFVPLVKRPDEGIPSNSSHTKRSGHE